MKVVSIHAFQGDAFQAQLSFPAGAEMEVIPSSTPNNGWLWVTYLGQTGWVPQAYVQQQVHQPTQPPTMAAPQLPPGVTAAFSNTAVTVPPQNDVDFGGFDDANLLGGGPGTTSGTPWSVAPPSEMTNAPAVSSTTHHHNMPGGAASEPNVFTAETPPAVTPSAVETKPPPTVSSGKQQPKSGGRSGFGRFLSRRNKTPPPPTDDNNKISVPTHQLPRTTIDDGIGDAVPPNRQNETQYEEPVTTTEKKQKKEGKKGGLFGRKK